MNVSACLVTRGDVDIQPILDSLPQVWEVLIWDNGTGLLTRWFYFDGWEHGEKYEGYWQHDMSVKQESVADLSVYGRYAAIEYASHDLIYVQDDDVIVSDPQAIVDEWVRATETSEIDDSTWWPDSVVVCNMPQEFRHDFYADHALVGFGAAFHRDAPGRAFDDWVSYRKAESLERMLSDPRNNNGAFLRCCDVVFTSLTPRVLADVPKQNLPYAEGPDRMYRQRGHVAERARMLELALEASDARIAGGRNSDSPAAARAPDRVRPRGEAP